MVFIDQPVMLSVVFIDQPVMLSVVFFDQPVENSVQFVLVHVRSDQCGQCGNQIPEQGVEQPFCFQLSRWKPCDICGRGSRNAPLRPLPCFHHHRSRQHADRYDEPLLRRYSGWPILMIHQLE